MSQESYTCVCCENEFEDIEQSNITDNGDPICEPCYNDDTSYPEVTIQVHHSKGNELYDNFDFIFIGSYCTMSTDSVYQEDFQKVDHYNNYRGYTDVVSDKWKEIGFVNVRFMDQSQEKLANAVNSFGDILLDNDIIYASSDAKTSNCMVSNLSYWVLAKDYKKALRVKKALMKKYNITENDF